MTADMFAILNHVTRLVEENKQEEAYVLMRDAIKEDNYGFARIFLGEWVKHLKSEDEIVQSKFALIILRLQKDFPEIAPPDTQGNSVVPANQRTLKVTEEVQAKEVLTLSFYDWQMTSISKASIRQKVDEDVLLARMLETGNLEPLAWARYKRGKASPDHRIRVKVTSATKERLEAEKDAEEVPLTKYVRKLLFGRDRAEKY